MVLPCRMMAKSGLGEAEALADLCNHRTVLIAGGQVVVQFSSQMHSSRASISSCSLLTHGCERISTVGVSRPSSCDQIVALVIAHLTFMAVA